jgi:hypothetical protein
VRVPFTFEQAQSALRRVLDKVPPNGEKNQQYKDTLIWLAVLELASDYDVLFVSTDKAFFANRDPSKGLAVELLADVAEAELSVIAVASLGDAAEQIRVSEPPVNVEEISLLIDQAALDVLMPVAEQAEFLIGARAGSNLHAFATEDPHVLAVTFAMTHALEDLREPPRRDAQAIAEGDCEVRNGEVASFRLSRAVIDWVEPSGEPGHAGNVYIYPRGIGERSEPFTVRTEIDLERS